MTDRPSAGPVCYRCTDTRRGGRVRLSVTHRRDVRHRYRDVERTICLDCLAAIGLLELSDEVIGERRA
ncbi:hypothetical protein [Halovivax gelatinilyticus]|uniref:hypothetical protein n=1 Tax=Halovivax gelatinilyticus TaxID=2961597 RepID=UPI0020CA4243|nr:hypothetical protein [Halovivax gelatinilyticus]